MLLAGNYLEPIRFHILDQHGVPVVLGLPSLRQHNPHIDWEAGIIRSWGTMCNLFCLKKSTSAGDQTSPTSTAMELEGVPLDYHDLHKVFNKKKATSLPPYWAYD